MAVSALVPLYSLARIHWAISRVPDQNMKITTSLHLIFEINRGRIYPHSQPLWNQIYPETIAGGASHTASRGQIISCLSPVTARFQANYAWLCPNIHIRLGSGSLEHDIVLLALGAGSIARGEDGSRNTQGCCRRQLIVLPHTPTLTVPL